MHDVQVGHRAVSADRGHAALVPIIKALRLRPLDHVQDVARGVAALLDRDRRNARERFAIFRGGKVGQVADHLHFGMTRNREVVLDHDPPGLVDRHA